MYVLGCNLFIFFFFYISGVYVDFIAFSARNTLFCNMCSGVLLPQERESRNQLLSRKRSRWIILSFLTYLMLYLLVKQTKKAAS